MSRTMKNMLFTTLAAPLLFSALHTQPAAAAPVGAFASPVVAAAGTAVTAAVPVEPLATEFKNCLLLNDVYTHGVGKRKAVDKRKGNGKPVTNFTKAPKVYAANKKLDRDEDGIACEKH